MGTELNKEKSIKVKSFLLFSLFILPQLKPHLALALLFKLVLSHFLELKSDNKL